MPRVARRRRGLLALHDARTVAPLPVNSTELSLTASLRFGQQAVLAPPC